MTADRAQPHESLETQALALLEQVVQRVGTRDPRRQLVRGLRRLSGVLGAWLGRPDESGLVVANAVSDRRIRAYLATVSIRIDQTPEGMGPVGRAWRSERVAWVDDWRSDPAGSPWARQVEAIGAVSSVAIVLHGRSGVREILTLYSDRRACFSANGWPRLIEYISSIFGVVLEEWDLRHRLEALARLDPLTQLPNRRALEDHLERIQARAQRQGRSFAMALVDLDHFKAVNDNHGHEAGDLLLESVAQRMRACLRREDFLARLGGDEFVIVFDGPASIAKLEPLLIRLHEAISAPLALPGGAVLRAQASAGLTLHPGRRDGPGLSVQKWLRASDVALYEAKRARGGRSRWWCLHGERTPALGPSSGPLGAQRWAVRGEPVIERMTDSLSRAHDTLQLVCATLEALIEVNGVDAVVALRAIEGATPLVTAWQVVGAGDPPACFPHGLASSMAQLADDMLRACPERAAAGASLGVVGDLRGDVPMAPVLAGALESLHLISAAAMRVRKGALACSMLLFSRHRGVFSGVEFTALARRIASLLALGWRQLPDLGAFTAEERRSRCAALINGGLEMYYQPIIDLKSGRLAKVESLVRLHDGHRLLSPHQFLPLLDDEQLFMVYRQGLRQALADVRAWAEQGQAINLSINIPAQGIKQACYREATAEALGRFPLPDGRWLFLEILETERLDLSDTRALLSELQPWQELGVRFAQDDLGSGYSSLLRLSRLPFEVVKIDQQLVRSHATAMDRKAVSKVLAFIAAITHLAHVLDLKVCVEGLENEALIDGARAIGADFGQGHAIAVPMPAGEVAGWAASRRPAPGTAPLNGESQLDAIYRELFEAASLDGINSDAHAQAYRRFYGLHADMVRQRLPAPEGSAIDPS